MYNLGISDLILLTYLLTSHLTRKHNLVPCFYLSADYKLPPRSIDVFDLTSSSSTGPRSHDTQPSRVHKTRRHRFCGHFEHTDTPLKGMALPLQEQKAAVSGRSDRRESREPGCPLARVGSSVPLSNARTFLFPGEEKGTPSRHTNSSK